MAKKETNTANTPNVDDKKKAEFERIAKDVFAQNEGLETIYFTSDACPFAKESDANKHAEKLDDKTVTPIIKED